MQLNVKIDDAVYKAAKKAAKAKDMRLRLYVEQALNDQESVRRLQESAAWEEALKLLPDKATDGATGGKDDCTPPPEEHVKARGKKKVRGAKPASKPAGGLVRPKINLSRLLP